MADHKDEQILDAVMALVGNLTTTGTNVQRGRVYPLDEEITRALSVHMGRATPTDEQVWPLERVYLEVLITAHVRETEDTIEQVLNTIKKEVLVAMMADHKLGLDFVIDTTWEGDGVPDMDVKEMPEASLLMNYKVKYQRSYNDPSA